MPRAAAPTLADGKVRRQNGIHRLDVFATGSQEALHSTLNGIVGCCLYYRNRKLVFGWFTISATYEEGVDGNPRLGRGDHGVIELLGEGRLADGLLGDDAAVKGGRHRRWETLKKEEQ